MTRITHQATFRRRLTQLHDRAASLETARQKAATGQAFQRASQDPKASAVAADLRANLQRYDTLERTHDVAAGELGAADSALGSLTQVMDRVQFVVRAAGGSIPADDDTLTAWAAELDDLRSSVLAEVNARFAGRPLFAGTADVPAAYDNAGTYQGNADVTTRTISPGVELDTTVVGTDLVEGADARSLIGVIDDVIAKLGVADQAGIAATDVGAIGAYRDQIVQVRAELGGRTNTLETTADRLGGDKLLLADRLESADGVALDQVLTELATAETGYQAALVATSRAQNLSLANYLQ